MNAKMHLQPMRSKAVWGSRVLLAIVIACAAILTSCGQVVREGQGNSYLIMQSLGGTSGAKPGAFTSQLLSDVITVVGGVPSTFNDPGQASLQLAMKDQVGTQPSTANFITITQYHVEYFRTDGQNVQGVGVPYAFDGAVTTTISGAGTVSFTLVRHTAKEEAPLQTLQSGASPITVIAKVTFYGHDQTGRGVSVSGQMEITFSNFGD
jgi:hypothetical protein